MGVVNLMESLGPPDDVAPFVSLLVGSDGAWVDGQVLRASGDIE